MSEYDPMDNGKYYILSETSPLYLSNEVSRWINAGWCISGSAFYVPPESRRADGLHTSPGWFCQAMVRGQERKPVAYKTVIGNVKIPLTPQVNALLAKGWELYGSPSAADTYDTQSMVHYGPLPEVEGEAE